MYIIQSKMKLFLSSFFCDSSMLFGWTADGGKCNVMWNVSCISLLLLVMICNIRIHGKISSEERYYLGTLYIEEEEFIELWILFHLMSGAQ